MISSRYAPIVALFLIIPLIPTVIHSYIGMEHDDGMTVMKIEPVLNGFSSKPTQRNPGWGQHIFTSHDWIERLYQNGQGIRIRFFAARAYDQKRLYHHPEIVLSHTEHLTHEGLVQLPGHPEIAVNLLHNNTSTRLVAYSLLYDGAFIKKPMLHQIKDSFNLLFSARKPMTLFYVSQPGGQNNSRFDQSAAASLLLGAIQSYQAQTTELNDR